MLQTFLVFGVQHSVVRMETIQFDLERGNARNHTLLVDMHTYPRRKLGTGRRSVTTAESGQYQYAVLGIDMAIHTIGPTLDFGQYFNFYRHAAFVVGSQNRNQKIGQTTTD